MEEKKEGKIKSFTDLTAWRKGHKLVLSIYKITKNFPNNEIFGLISQMRRSAVSITSNIAEGFSRKTSKDKKYFYYISLGSITEIQNQLIISHDLNYINREDFQEISKQTIDVHKLINGLVKSSKTFNP